jgi:pyrimidine operon attenuation protein/uracil phosphoribosyltransferase
MIANSRTYVDDVLTAERFIRQSLNSVQVDGRAGHVYIVKWT